MEGFHAHYQELLQSIHKRSQEFGTEILDRNPFRHWLDNYEKVKQADQNKKEIIRRTRDSPGLLVDRAMPSVES